MCSCAFVIMLFKILLIILVSFLQYFLNSKVAKEPVPLQLEQIAKEILVPLLAVFHHLVEKVVVFILPFVFWSLSPLGILSQVSLVTGYLMCLIQILAIHDRKEMETEKLLLTVCKCIYFAVSITFCF